MPHSTVQQLLQNDQNALGILAGASHAAFAELGLGGVVSQASRRVEPVLNAAPAPEKPVAPAEAGQLVGFPPKVVGLGEVPLRKAAATFADIAQLPVEPGYRSLITEPQRLNEQVFSSDNNQPDSDPAVLGFDSAAPGLLTSVTEAVVLGSDGVLMNLLELIQETVENADQPFDGSRQENIREFIIDSIGEFRSVDFTVRDFLQEHVRGEIKELVQGSLERLTGDNLDPVTDPLFAVDYYGTSADVINETLSVVQNISPMGTTVLPRIGPLSTQLLSSLTAQ